MRHIVRKSILTKSLMVFFFAVILAGCSNKSMYTTGDILNKMTPRILRAPMSIVTVPLKYNQEEENKRIAEEKRVLRKAEAKREREEYKRLFNSLSKEDQAKIIAEKEKTNREQLKQQGESSRALIEGFSNMLKPNNTYILY